MQERQKMSPAYNADKLDVPLLIIYGGADDNVVPEHAERMLAALDKAGKKYQKIYKPNEGHGFRRPEHMIEIYSAMLQFFDQYIGPDAGKPAAAQTNKAP
jgi:acylaminoacyl-peptidase